MMIALPLFQLVLFGNALDTDVRHMPTVVYDADRNAASRDLVRYLRLFQNGTTSVGRNL